MTNVALREEFQVLLDRWAAAIVANDADRIGAFMENDWVLVTPEGGPRSREGFLSFVASGDLTHDETTFEVIEVRQWKDVAIVLAHGKNRGAWKGKTFTSDEWVTEVFVRRDEGWRCTTSALTPNYAALAKAPTDPLASNRR